MKAKLRNVQTGEVVEVHSTTDSPDSSYGLECWVDDEGQSYGQCQFGAPFGFELLPLNEQAGHDTHIREVERRAREGLNA